MKKFGVFILLIATNAFAQQKETVLSEADKVWGLSKIWSEVRYNFANMDLTNVNWDSAYKAAIPKVSAAATTLDYYKELAMLVALLKDGHTSVSFPNSYYAARRHAPFVTKKIEERVFITDVLNDSLPIEIGDEILEIDKENVIRYGEKNILPYQSASTYASLMLGVYHYDLLYGLADAPIQLKIRKKNNQIAEVSVSRKMKHIKKNPPFKFNVLKDNVGLLTINSFGTDQFENFFDSIYAALLTTKSLIIDIRENDGGDGAQGFYALSHFIDQATYSNTSKTRQYTAYLNAAGLMPTWLLIEGSPIKPNKGKQRYTGNIAMLAGAKTFSAAEDFLAAFDYAKRGIIIGQATGGSTGQPYSFSLPGGGGMRICTKREIYPNGKEFIGKGIMPDIAVPETIQAFVEKRDLVMEKAVEYLKNK